MALKQNAQAVTELAIVGSLVIIAFAFLINYSEKLNRQQANIQQTFRAALEEAGKANNSVTYTKKVFQRMPNVGNPMELGQLETFGDSANVLWQDGKDRDDVYYKFNVGSMTGYPEYRVVTRAEHPGVVKYELNQEFIPIDRKQNLYDDDGNLIPFPQPAEEPETTEGFTSAVVATTRLTQAGSGSIATTKTLNAKDTLAVTVNLDVNADGQNEQVTRSYKLGAGGKYSSGGGGIQR